MRHVYTSWYERTRMAEMRMVYYVNIISCIFVRNKKQLQKIIEGELYIIYYTTFIHGFSEGLDLVYNLWLVIIVVFHRTYF